MVSASIPLSTPFISLQSAVAAHPPPPPPNSVRFRPPPRISAAYATSTAERTATSNSISLIATAGSLYEVLGIQMGSSNQEIKNAYRGLARVLHPDVASNGQQDTTSTDDFIRIHTAYSTLSDPQKRADYDRTLFRRRMPVINSSLSMSPSSSPTVVTSRFSGYARRTWETDQCW